MGNETSTTNTTVNYIATNNVNAMGFSHSKSNKALITFLLMEEKYKADGANALPKTDYLRYAILECNKQDITIGDAHEAFTLLNRTNNWDMSNENFDSVIDQLIGTRDPKDRLDALESREQRFYSIVAAYLMKTSPQETETISELSKLTQEVKETIGRVQQANVKHDELKQYFKEKQLALAQTSVAT